MHALALKDTLTYPLHTQRSQPSPCQVRTCSSRWDMCIPLTLIHRLNCCMVIHSMMRCEVLIFSFNYKFDCECCAYCLLAIFIPEIAADSHDHLRQCECFSLCHLQGTCLWSTTAPWQNCELHVPWRNRSFAINGLTDGTYSSFHIQTTTSSLLGKLYQQHKGYYCLDNWCFKIPRRVNKPATSHSNASVIC